MSIDEIYDPNEISDWEVHDYYEYNDIYYGLSDPFYDAASGYGYRPNAMRKKKMNKRDILFTAEAYDPQNIFFADVLKLYEDLDDNLYCSEYKYSAKCSINEVTDNLVAIIQRNVPSDYTVRYQVFDVNVVNITCFNADKSKQLIIARIRDNYRECSPEEVNNRDISIKIVGKRDIVEKIYKEVIKKKNVKLPRVTWHYSAGGRAAFKPILLEKPKVTYDSFYPWLEDGIKNYFKRYLNSDSNILIFIGAPGTGKTSLIRKFIYDHKLNTTVTYDEALLNSDSFFVQYLTDNSTDLLVVEDADLMLTSRENDGNKIMSKLLNVSDGLVKVFNKKIIFTANLQKLDDIDPALLRPGRCFDALNFRTLKWDETKKVCEDAALTLPKRAQDYTLAEIFNMGNPTNQAVPLKKKVGFI